MQCFSVDESGYTGFDLLNDAQRFQGASAICVAEDEARRIIKEFFPALQGPELKYSTIARRDSQRERVLPLLAHVLRTHNCVTYVCDKRFLLTMMFLEYAAEPFYYARGHDFYADGQNYSLGSLLHAVGPGLLGQSEFHALLAAFQAAIKAKTDTSLRHLVRVANSIRWQELPEAIGPIAGADPDCLSAIGTPGVSTDAALVVLQSLISRMEMTMAEAYRIEHDRSKNLEQYHQVLSLMIGHRAEVEFRASKLASMRFPLKLSSVDQVESKDRAAIQLADVLIGSAIDAVNSMAGLRPNRAFAERVLALYTDDQIIHMMPSLDFAAQREFRQGAQSGAWVDYAARHFHK